MGTNIMQKLSLFNFLTFVILFQFTSHMTNSARLTRAIMMSMAHNTNFNCTDLTITEKNLTASIILSGTVTTCDNIQAGTYKCSLQVIVLVEFLKIILWLHHEDVFHCNYILDMANNERTKIGKRSFNSANSHTIFQLLQKNIC